MADAVDMTSLENDAIANLTKTFEGYGLGSLAQTIAQFIYQGYSADTVSLLLQDTPEYKQRFAANEARRKAGLPVLSPAEYLATEKSYRDVMRSAGLPQGFYDTPDDFQQFISKDISASELKGRVDAAQKAVDNTDPYYTQALSSMYGMTAGDMIAHLLDPERAAPLIERKARAAEYGAAAMRQGLQATTPTTYEQYASGVGTGIGAEQGMQAIAQMLPGTEALANISGEQYDQSTAEQEVFGGLASARRKREQLVSQEEARFKGVSGVSAGSLGGGIEGMF